MGQSLAHQVRAAGVGVLRRASGWLRQLNIFAPRPGRRFAVFDMWVYRLFYWRWSRHFQAYPDLREGFLGWMRGYHDQRRKPLGQLTVVPPTDEATRRASDGLDAPPPPR